MRRPSPGNRGRSAEDLVAWAFRRLRERRLAFVERVTPPFRAAWRGGRLAAFPERRGLPDFVGFLPPAGRGVLFDVKSTREASWHWDLGRARSSKASQAADLEEAGRMGVVAGLLVAFWPRRLDAWPTWAWIPWPLLSSVSAGRWTPEALRQAGADVWTHGPDTELAGIAMSDVSFLAPLLRQAAVENVADLLLAQAHAAQEEGNAL
jgi:hypothetical protein